MKLRVLWGAIGSLIACDVTEPMPELKAHARARIVSGLVMEASPAAVVLRDAEGRDHRLEIDAATRAYRGDDPVALDALASGQKVRATYVQSGKKRVARELSCQANENQRKRSTSR